ncbi:MAG: 4-(cytidine 5'-diphospho)-2-C-methyl-D-erythritol kinase [Nitrospirae bacterium]|nr:4-(cytidine 5'-diphospho)-2-C-methyl-D-erythritol kinase [Nitrospirota bacterium]
MATINTITLLSPAKINLCLSVLGRRPDAYHDVEMLMQMVGLFDEVTVSLGGSGVSVSCDSHAVPSGEENIAWKAALEILRISGQETGLAIEIKKNIPVAAGLGGGSGNAAAVLMALNRLLGIGLDRDRLAEIGARIGMDVPFFFFGPTALARGRGEILTELTPLPHFPVLLVNPGFETSTAWVYKNLNLGLTKKGDCNKIARLNLRNIALGLHNDLEQVTSVVHPVINKIKDALLDQGALGALMSGSGPTVFGIFETVAACRVAADRLSPEGWRSYPVETLTASPFAELRSG